MPHSGVQSSDYLPEEVRVARDLGVEPARSASGNLRWVLAVDRDGRSNAQGPPGRVWRRTLPRGGRVGSVASRLARPSPFTHRRRRGVGRHRARGQGDGIRPCRRARRWMERKERRLRPGSAKQLLRGGATALLRCDDACAENPHFARSSGCLASLCKRARTVEPASSKARCRRWGISRVRRYRLHGTWNEGSVHRLRWRKAGRTPDSPLIGSSPSRGSSQLGT